MDDRRDEERVQPAPDRLGFLRLLLSVRVHPGELPKALGSGDETAHPPVSLSPLPGPDDHDDSLHFHDGGHCHGTIRGSPLPTGLQLCEYK